MSNTQKQLTCKELVQGQFDHVEQTYQEAEKYFNDYDNATEGEKIALKVIDEHKSNFFHEYENLFDYVNNDALSWDYIEAGTFNSKQAGYYRLLLSWGGPSDEFRIYTAQNDHSVDVIEYHFMDWYDGASINVPQDSLSWDVCQMFLDREVA
jgi:hypothetical protein